MVGVLAASWLTVLRKEARKACQTACAHLAQASCPHSPLAGKICTRHPEHSLATLLEVRGVGFVRHKEGF